MIAAVMLYAIAVAMLLGAAAWAVEKLLRERRLPTRGVWAACLIASVSVPTLTLLLSTRTPRLHAQQLGLAEIQTSTEKAGGPLQLRAKETYWLSSSVSFFLRCCAKNCFNAGKEGTFRLAISWRTASRSGWLLVDPKSAS